jgi:hypothetical protein
MGLIASTQTPAASPIQMWPSPVSTKPHTLFSVSPYLVSKDCETMDRSGLGEEESRSRPCGVVNQIRPKWSSRNEPITFAGNPFATV